MYGFDGSLILAESPSAASAQFAFIHLPTPHWRLPLIPALVRQRQADFQASQDYTVRPWLNKSEMSESLLSAPSSVQTS